jgi:pimeloyl-ACP methyl ester carboxylesterase
MLKPVVSGLAAVLLAAGCMTVRVDESSVFKKIPFDAKLAERSHETIEGESGFASELRWVGAWSVRQEQGRLYEPTPAFVPAKVQHGKTDGQGIAWSLVTREGANRPLIVRCGGNASTRQQTGFVYSVMALPHGDVLLFDYPGSGETGGAPTTQSFEAMRAELKKLIREKAAGRTLVLWGHSLGGFVCAELAQQLPETKGVILETSARNAAEVSKAWAPWFAGPFVKVEVAAGLSAYDNADALKGFKGPVLVLGATHDATLPVQLARSLSKALKDEGVDEDYIEFGDGGHSTLPGQRDYPGVIGHFFSRLKPGA